MEKIGFIIPNYPDEKRVAILPEHIKYVRNKCVVECGFGQIIGVSDDEYIKAGCVVMERNDIFENCKFIFSLKLIQPVDYKFLKNDTTIIGWTHPLGSGKVFFDTVAQEKNLRVVDLDNIFPRVYFRDKVMDIPFIPKNFIYKNSINAGIASVSHALLAMGMCVDSTTYVAILGNGNVSQGAMQYLSKLNVNIRMFYRKTMQDFKNTLGEYDIIVNGIEVDDSNIRIISKDDLQLIKKGCLIIDAAADAGNAIEGTHYSSISLPIYEENGHYYYVVNNAPSVLYRKASFDISESFSKYVFNEDCSRFNSL